MLKEIRHLHTCDSLRRRRYLCIEQRFNCRGFEVLEELAMTMSGDTFGCHNWAGAFGIRRAEARGAVKHPAVSPP